MNLQELRQYDSSIELIGGKEDFEFLKLSTFDEVSSGSLYFIKNKKFYLQNLKLIENSSLSESAVIVESSFFDKMDEEILGILKKSFEVILKCSSISLCMSFLSKPFYESKMKDLNDLVDGRQMGSATIHPTAWIAQGVQIGEGVIIEEGVKIHSGSRIMSKSHIKASSEIFPNVTIYPFCEIGKGCRIHSGSVIGADGFGYNFDKGVHHKVWHMGSVIIGDNVEIGANSCIDQGTFSPTKIGDGTKIDNHVQVGHNVELGQGVILCGHVAIGGSTKIGDFTVFGGKSGAGDGLTLGKACQVAGGGLVNCDWPDGSVVGGHPARPLKEWMKGLAYIRKLSLGK